METRSNVIDKNWKALIKPNKLDITSNEDKTVAKVVAEPLEKGFGQTKVCHTQAHICRTHNCSKNALSHQFCCHENRSGAYGSGGQVRT